MTRLTPSAALLVTSLAVGVAGFAAGFAASGAFPFARTAGAPIINPAAWEESAPVQTVSHVTSLAAPLICPAWEISDVAMEEVLNVMLRRGWRPPTQGAAAALMDGAGLAAVDPDAPMPRRRAWAAPVARDEARREPAATTNAAAPEPGAYPDTDVVSPPA